MNRFNVLLDDLSSLQSRFQQNMDRFWSIKRLHNDAFQRGVSEDGFLPRRLSKCRKELQQEFELLLLELNHLVTNSRIMTSRFIRFDSEDDVYTAMRIRAKIRYIKNAFAGDLPVMESTLSKLNRTLPRH